ncbi:MAG TPA: GNAT family N-acetyltransferase [Burkholderiales bacterium]|nr:GNAT family N-acetyltransferase [Burkholderiales bacterium]
MSQIEVSVVTEATEEVVAAFSRLIPQLSTTASPPDRELIAQIISAPSNTVLVARDRSNGARIVGTLTLVMFRIPTALRAWIEDVVVDSSVRGRGVGEALTEEAVRIAQARGARTIDLTSRRSRQAAHRLYEKVGFAVRDTSVYRYMPSHGKKAG